MEYQSEKGTIRGSWSRKKEVAIEKGNHKRFMMPIKKKFRSKNVIRKSMAPLIEKLHQN
ncbi:hypothetical protein [Robertmurraya sp. Marseille-Q9965]